MASLWFFFSVRDHSTNGQGARVAGLTPTWTLFNALADNSAIANPPAVIEIGQGLYKYAYDAEVFGEAAGQIDALGGANPNNVTLMPGDRYIDLFSTREPSRLLTAINAAGQVALSPSGFEAIEVENGVNARQALSPILAASAGVLIGAGTGTIVIQGGNVSQTRITATTDNAGNRTAVTLTLPPALAAQEMMASYYFPSTYYPEPYFPFGKTNQPLT